ncbi:MAG: flagellar hook-basal body complex protein [Steroidobacter sp.]
MISEKSEIGNLELEGVVMLDAIQISATGMRAHETEINTISHNVANISTVGFRRQIVAFNELSADLAAATTDTDKTGAMDTYGAGSLATVLLSTTAGDLKQTGEALNVAIDGAGFLEVMRADGSLAYTRAGTLAINDAGDLTTATGEVLNSHINVPAGATNLQITTDGQVLATLDGQMTQLGKIELVSFANPAALTPIGNNLYAATSNAGELQAAFPGESGMGSLKQGYLETSNVQMIDEMVALMIAQRGFEMNSRVVQVADQVQSLTNGLIK